MFIDWERAQKHKAYILLLSNKTSNLPSYLQVLLFKVQICETSKCLTVNFQSQQPILSPLKLHKQNE